MASRTAVDLNMRSAKHEATEMPDPSHHALRYSVCEQSVAVTVYQRFLDFLKSTAFWKVPRLRQCVGATSGKGNVII